MAGDKLPSVENYSTLPLNFPCQEGRAEHLDQGPWKEERKGTYLLLFIVPSLSNLPNSAPVYSVSPFLPLGFINLLIGHDQGIWAM